jgi:hypothetical protein
MWFSNTNSPRWVGPYRCSSGPVATLGTPTVSLNQPRDYLPLRGGNRCETAVGKLKLQVSSRLLGVLSKEEMI